MPVCRSADATAGYDPMILFVLHISPVLLVSGIFVVFEKYVQRVSMGI